MVAERTGWHRVSRREHCPVCDDHDSPCLIFENEDVLCTHRESDEWTDSFMGGWWHRATRDTTRPLSWNARTPAPSTPHRTRADATTLDAVYRVIRAHSVLSDEHHTLLMSPKHGLSDAQARRYGTPPADQAAMLADLLARFPRETLLTVPGFREKNGHLYFHDYTSSERPCPRLALFVHDLQGRIVAIHLRDTARVAHGPKYLPATSVNATHPDAPSPGTPAHIALPAEGVRHAHIIGITEGVKKADVAADALGYPVIAQAGAGCTTDGIAVLAQIADERPEVTTVVLMLDRDDPAAKGGLTVAAVDAARTRLAAAAVELSFAVRDAHWSHATAKGIDDLLAAGHTFTLERFRPIVTDMSAPAAAPIGTPDKDTLIATQRAELADVKAQVKAWEQLYYINRAFPDKAKRVLVHIHKVFGVRIGQHLPDVMPCTLYPDEQNLQAEGFAISAYDEALDILYSLGLLTREKRKKLNPGRGKDWYWEYGLNGPAINALWQQLPTLTKIAPTARQIKAETSREERLQKAIAEEKPTQEVVISLKREVAQEREERGKATYERDALAYERDAARAQAEAAARERDRALHEAQRIIQENQRPPVAATRIMCRAGCGSFIQAVDWCCDECREREREEADSRLESNLECTGRNNHPLPSTVTTRLDSNLESADTNLLLPCAGGCGTLTPHGWTCKPCRERPPGPLHIPDSTTARREVSHGQ
jgi:hypothetical protein